MPGLNNIAASSASESTVDSMPTVVRPPSSIIATRSPRASRTCCAVVGDNSPNRLALGAATGRPASWINAKAMALFGIRTPTVSNPAVNRSGTCGCFGKTNVSGPGQKDRARHSAHSGHSRTSVRAISIESTWTIRGWTAGGPWQHRFFLSPQYRARWRPARTPSRSERPPVPRRESAQRRGAVPARRSPQSGRSSFPSPETLPVCL